MSKNTNACKWPIKTHYCNTHLPCLFTAWMLKSHLDLRKDITESNWLKQYMLAVCHSVDDCGEKKLYLRELRYWLKFTESNATRKVFSATSLAYNNEYIIMSNYAGLVLKHCYVDDLFSYFGSIGSTWVAFDSWKDCLNSSRINLWQDPGKQMTFI